MYENDEIVDLADYDEENVTALLQEKFFISDIPFQQIIEKMDEQFDDYINNRDSMNWVGYFLDRIFLSYADLETEPEFQEEGILAIKQLQDEFTQHVLDKMTTRIGIDITSADTIVDDTTYQLIYQLYEYFILNARRNFQLVISEYIIKNIKSGGELFFTEMLDAIEKCFMTYIDVITPETFIQYSGENDILSAFQGCEFTGNFLRKYTASLATNEDFKADIINYITMGTILNQTTPVDEI